MEVLKNENKKLELIIFLVVTLIVFSISYNTLPVSGGVGNNTTVLTKLNIGNVYPDILNVSVDYGNTTFYLIPNQTKIITCEALVVDYNNDSDLRYATAEFFNSSYGAADDNNNHYKNKTCDIIRDFSSWRGVADDNYSAVVNCTYQVWYYANPGNWNCTVFVNDSMGWNATGSDNITIAELLALNLPNEIDYGLVNATEVSLEKIANVSNAGNVRLNLSLDGYGNRRYDNLSMNCSLGSVKNISIMHEKYNLTITTPGVLSLTQVSQSHINLTSSPVIKSFGLAVRQDDTNDDAINATYWRIYVPLGVAGSCTGNIVFGATTASGS